MVPTLGSEFLIFSSLYMPLSVVMTLNGVSSLPMCECKTQKIGREFWNLLFSKVFHDYYGIWE